MAGFITNKEAAEFLGIAEGTLNNWRSDGLRKVPYFKIGRHVRYKIADLERWVEAQAVNRIEAMLSSGVGAERGVA